MAGMQSNQSIIPTFDVSGKTAEPKMAFNFAHLLSAAYARCARIFSLFSSSPVAARDTAPTAVEDEEMADAELDAPFP